MKKIIALLLVFAMLLTVSACGSTKKSLDIDALYGSLEQYLPEMFEPDEDTLLNFLGVQAADCTKYKIAICAEGLRVDEVWLIEAKDQAALERLPALAKHPVQAGRNVVLCARPVSHCPAGTGLDRRVVSGAVHLS